MACVLRWVGGGGQGSVRVFGAGDLDQEGSISLTLSATLTDHRTCDGPFCHGQITWENGPSPSWKVRHC